MKVIAAILALALPTLAQTASQLKAELRTKETAAKKDPEALAAVGVWAKDKGMTAEAKRIFLAVLKIDPNHAVANEGLGNALFDNKWMPAREAEALRKKAEAAEYGAKGMVEVQGVWVEKDFVEDAKNGIFHHDNQLVTKAEKMLLMRGWVHHPDTDELIDPKFLEKAKEHQYPIGNDGHWVDAAAADKFHADPTRPWVVRSTYATLLSTLPLAKIAAYRLDVDAAFEQARKLLGDAIIKPTSRPLLLIAASQDEYSQYGKALGDGTSAWSAFFMPQDRQIEVPPFGPMRATVCDGTGAIGPYTVRDAAGIAIAEALAAGAGATLPVWFRHAVGSYTSRFQNESVAAFYAKPHVARGGVKSLKAFFASFDLNGNMSGEELIHNTFQAGLMLDFAANGDDAAAKAALGEIKDALTKGKGADAEKAIAKLQTALENAESKVVDYLRKLAAK